MKLSVCIFKPIPTSPKYCYTLIYENFLGGILKLPFNGNDSHCEISQKRILLWCDR